MLGAYGNFFWKDTSQLADFGKLSVLDMDLEVSSTV